MEGAVTIQLVSMVAVVGGVVAGVVMWLNRRFSSIEQRVTDGLDELRKEHTKFQLEVADRYVGSKDLAQFEQRLMESETRMSETIANMTDQLRHLTNRIDSWIDFRQRQEG